jgi:hypothetical protein
VFFQARQSAKMFKPVPNPSSHRAKRSLFRHSFRQSGSCKEHGLRLFKTSVLGKVNVIEAVARSEEKSSLHSNLGSGGRRGMKRSLNANEPPYRAARSENYVET